MGDGHRIPLFGKIIILIDDPDVDLFGAWLAVIAVYACTGCICRGKCADNRIIPRLVRGVVIAQNVFHILRAAHTGQHGQHARPIQGILQALVGR